MQKNNNNMIYLIVKTEDSYNFRIDVIIIKMIKLWSNSQKSAVCFYMKTDQFFTAKLFH